MRKFNPFRSKQHHESSHRTATATTTTATFKTHSRPPTSVTARITPPTYPITISAPIINTTDKLVINDKDQSEDIPSEEQPAIVESDITEEQTAVFEEPEKMSDEYNHPDEQPVSSLSTSSNQSSPSTRKIESTAPAMVGNNPKEEILTSCKATAMIYNDAQKKWMHCASNGPAKIQLLFTPDSQSYRIVGRQIQDHEVVLNHSIVKGIKYNQATPTFHQWRDQSGVYGLNFASKLDAQEFGTLMTQILESVNGATNSSSQTNANGGASLPSSAPNNNNNNNTSTTSYKRQTSQPSSSLPPTAPTVSINSTSTSSSSSVSEPTQQQQQQHSSSSYNNQLRPNLNSTNSVPVSTSNNYYSQHQPSAEEDDTNYALISDSYSSYGDNSTNKNNNIPQAPPLNLPMSATGNAPPPPPPGPPPPPPPPPLPGGFGSAAPPAPALVLPTANGNNGANAARKSSAATTAGPMDLMSEMAAKFAQRRKNADEGDKPDSSNAARVSPKPASTLPPTAAAPIQTSPRVARKAGDPQSATHYTSNDLEKLKSDILTEVRKDIEKAKQEILAAILDQHKSLKK